MKYSFFIGLLFFLVACNDSQITSAELKVMEKPPRKNSVKMSADSVKLNQNTGLVLYKDQPYSGTAVKHYPNGQLSQTIDYHLGKRDGYYIKNFEDGVQSFKAYYKNGKTEGKSYSWWRNGNLRSESNHIAGVSQGIQLQWYKDGAQFKRLQLVDGQEEGLQKSWRRNGKIYNNYEAKRGRIFGLKRASLCFQLDDEIVQYENK